MAQLRVARGDSPTLGWVSALIGVVGLVGIFCGSCARHARADAMDLSLSRMRTQGADGCPTGGEVYCRDDDAWRGAIGELGIALMPPILTPAQSVGPRRFRVSLETGVTPISSDASYWRRGVEGDEATALDAEYRFVRPAIVFSRVTAQKGLPGGFEVAATAGHAYRASSWLWGVAVSWSVLEGFREGPLGALPEVAIRAALHAVTGDREYRLTIPTAELVVSKALVVGHTAELGALLGVQLGYILANSDVVDLSPDVDGFAECVPSPAGRSAALDCLGDATDLQRNQAVFPSIRAPRLRLAIGGTFAMRGVSLAVALHVEPLSPGRLAQDFAGLPRQWSLAFGLGYSH